MLMARLMMVAVLSLAVAHAAPIVMNGAPTNASGNEMTSYIQAEDFQLDGYTTLTGARIWGFAFEDIGSGFLGTISWQIYSSDGGQPGSLLHFGEATPLVSAGAPNCCDGTAMELYFSLPGLGLEAGTYWFGVHNGPLTSTDPEYFYWQTAANNATLRGMQQMLPGGAWTSTNLEHAFELDGATFSAAAAPEDIPEPSTMVLSVLGLSAAWFARRKRSV